MYACVRAHVRTLLCLQCVWITFLVKSWRNSYLLQLLTVYGTLP